ncbi:hypothetical protein BABA_13767 [Neobacillus bataviensis LMG 21833]|uniref:AtuA-like ferredoxin-fold domain-containing protein n=1 Tax=Neobacillus bataviensis LMG 21833 TaxID=1117379 RepID=K6C745_9BACI|nr:hypothetical protein [Neobacillus bataviensis]EKN66960.1 hypothetical protein BABA_13767 [Neobacillus bataviensis LMG 21833]
MATVQLREVAQARSGDKGSSSDITLFAPNAELYEVFKKQVTAERVKEHFTGIVEGEVYRYEVPNVLALKFLCKEALGGNAASTLRLDNLGKCFGGNLLRMKVEIPEDLLNI